MGYLFPAFAYDMRTTTMKSSDESSFQFYVTTTIAGLWAHSLIIVYQGPWGRFLGITIAALIFAYSHLRGMIVRPICDCIVGHTQFARSPRAAV